MLPQPVRGNLYVAGLPSGMSDEQLAEMFDSYGVVLRAFVARDPTTGAPLDNGLVELAPDEAVEEAVAGVGASGIEARRADPEMSLALPPRSAARPAARPTSPMRPAASALVAAPRFAVERMRPAPRPHAAMPPARPVPPPPSGPASSRPMGRLSLPIGTAAGRAPAPARAD